MAMQLVKLFSPKKDEHGNVHWGPGDEARFYRAVAMAGKYAEARAPYESPRLAAIAAGNLGNQDDDDGSDPHENLMRIIEGWIEAEGHPSRQAKARLSRRPRSTLGIAACPARRAVATRS